jgi:hypothetical protein
MTKMTQPQKDALEPFARVYADMVMSMEEMSGPDLQKLRRACVATSKTNCWWASYRVAQVLQPLVEAELAGRAQVAEP